MANIRMCTIFHLHWRTCFFFLSSFVYNKAGNMYTSVQYSVILQARQLGMSKIQIHPIKIEIALTKRPCMETKLYDTQTYSEVV